MKITKTALALLIIPMILISLIACVKPNGNNVDSTDSSTADSGSTETDTVLYDENGFLLDSLPEDLDYDGQEIQIFHWTDYAMEEFNVESQSAKAVDDEIYLRNLRTEERLGVTLKFNGTAGNASNTANFLSVIRNDIESGLNEYDIIAGYSLSQAVVSVNGCCRNLLDYEYLDFDKPWWPQSLLTEATIKNKLYFASGDISANMIYVMYVNYYNADIIEELNLDNPNALALTGGWTLEKFYQYAKTAYLDLNTNGIVDESDRLGFMTTSINTDPFFYAAGLKTVDKGANDELSVSSLYFSEKAVDLITKWNDFIWNSGSALLISKSAVGQDAFAAKNLMFLIDTANIAITTFSKSNVDYGILPVPKYNSNQSNYITTIGNNFTLYSISTGSQNDEVASAVLECYASENYRLVTPALFEQTLKIKYSKDTDTSAIYDIIRENVTFDIGRIFHKEINYLTQKLFRDTISGNKNDWMSVGAANLDVIKNCLTNLENAFSN